MVPPFVGVLVLFAPLTPAQFNLASLIATSTRVLKVEVRRADGSYSLGSGVLVAEGRLVTNCHVTQEAVTVSILSGSARWPVTAQASNVPLDLCMLESPGLTGTPVTLGSVTTLHPGSAVAALGYTGGGSLRVVEGRVFALHRHAGSHVIQSTTFFASGASGGGLFDQDGHLIGILTFVQRGGASQYHYYAAPVDWIAPMLGPMAHFVPLDAPAPAAPAPAATPEPPYWAHETEALPRFLRAPWLEQGSQWHELLALGSEWRNAEPDNAEPWYWHGLALARTHQLADAQSDLEQALIRTPDWAPALHQLGVVQALRAQCPAARTVASQLRTLDLPLSMDLEHTLEAACPVPAPVPASSPLVLEPA